MLHCCEQINENICVRHMVKYKRRTWILYRAVQELLWIVWCTTIKTWGGSILVQIGNAPSLGQITRSKHSVQVADEGGGQRCQLLSSLSSYVLEWRQILGCLKNHGSRWENRYVQLSHNTPPNNNNNNNNNNTGFLTAFTFFNVGLKQQAKMLEANYPISKGQQVLQKLPGKIFCWWDLQHLSPD